MVLEIAEGPRSGAKFDLPSDCVVLVGRSRHCHCRVGPDSRCSRVHFIMEVAPPKCRLRDLGSTNGTFVNGQRVVEAEVGDGDAILIGQTKLLVRAPAPAAEQPAGGFEVLTDSDEEVGPLLGIEGAPAAVIVSGRAEAPDERTAPVMQCLRCGQATAATREMLAAGGYVCQPCREAMRERGETIPGYRLLKQFDVGGMALLWLAEDTRTGGHVAVKTMIPELAASQRAVRMFHRESRISLGLRHPNIVRFVRTGQYQGQLYIVMEYVDGVDAERLRTQRGGQLPAAEVIAVGGQVLEALDYAHRQGIVHRDVKPSNILVQGQFPGYQVKVTDFGLARVYRAAGRTDITRRGDVRGSIPFMPPEQVLNCRGVDQRADIFALGATLYHLMTGEYCRDFNVKKKAPMLTVIEDEIVPIDRRAVAVPEPVAEVIQRALQREPDDRFQTAGEMNQALQQAARSLG